MTVHRYTNAPLYDINVKSLAYTTLGAIGQICPKMLGWESGSRPSSWHFRGVLERRAGLRPNLRMTRGPLRVNLERKRYTGRPVPGIPLHHQLYPATKRIISFRKLMAVVQTRSADAKLPSQL